MNKGIWYGIGAYAAWGVLPVFWKLLQHVPALQIVSHRIVWSCVLLCAVLALSGQWREFRSAVRQPRVFGIYLGAATLIGVNWFVYVWAVNAGFIIETSLGYFINPLVSVALGVIFLRERLRPWQWLPVGLATIGVLYLTFIYGALPWIALTLAFAFGFYGLLKKVAPLGSFYGLTLETAILSPLVLIYLIAIEWVGEGAFLHTGLLTDVLIICAGVVTSVPMLLFASAARRIPLSLVGILQYIAPTLQFLIGVFVYDEPFDMERLLGFSIIWVALLIFGIEGWLTHRAQQAVVVSEQQSPA